MASPVTKVLTAGIGEQITTTNTLTATGTSVGGSAALLNTTVGKLDVTATDPNGKVTSYAYDAKGDVTSITNALGQVTHFTSYDADGRPLTIQDPNGLVTTLTSICAMPR